MACAVVDCGEGAGVLGVGGADGWVVAAEVVKLVCRVWVEQMTGLWFVADSMNRM